MFPQDSQEDEDDDDLCQLLLPDNAEELKPKRKRRKVEGKVEEGKGAGKTHWSTFEIKIPALPYYFFSTKAEKASRSTKAGKTPQAATASKKLAKKPRMAQQTVFGAGLDNLSSALGHTEKDFQAEDSPKRHVTAPVIHVVCHCYCPHHAASLPLTLTTNHCCRT